MPIESRFSLQIPHVSLPTYLFTSPTRPLPSVPIFIDEKRPSTHYLSLSTYRSWSKRLAAGLLSAGLQPGDRVLLFSPNSYFAPVLFMGIVMAGGICTGLSPGSGVREVVYQLRDSGAKWILCSREGLAVMLEAVEGVGNDGEASRKGVYVFDGEVVGEGDGDIKHWSSLLASEQDGDAFRWEEISNEEEGKKTVALNYSSGTTGMPKGVVISHRNIVANTAQFVHMQEMNPGDAEKRETARWVGFLPMCHAVAQLLFAMCAPKTETSVYMSPGFDFIQMLENIQKFKIGHLIIVPPIVVALAKHPLVRSGKYDLSSVTRISVGAAPLSKEIIAEVETLWPPGTVQISQGWGLTEATACVLNSRPHDTPPQGSVGEIQANSSAKVMNEDGTSEVPRGQQGEIWVKGPNIMQEYWRNPQATREVLTSDGWLKTGDVGFCDKGGWWWIVDRVKDLIKVNGYPVAPAELEALLLEHPAVADAGVVEVSIDGIDLPRAYIVVKPQARETTTPEDISAFVRENAMRHKWLAGGVVFVDTVPKNPSGKILRRVLREKAKAEVVGDEKVSREVGSVGFGVVVDG